MTKKTKSRIKTIGLIGSIASIIGLLTFFLPSDNTPNIDITSNGENSPAINSSGEVNIEYNSYNNAIIPIPEEPKQSIAEKNKLRREKIKYYTDDKSISFENRLLADIDNQTYALIEAEEEICIQLHDVKDFDGNGSLDALVTNITACGGNCCGNSYFFYSYSGDGHFVRSEDFGYSWVDPEIERWKGRWSVLVTSHNEGVNQHEHEEIKERYVLDVGKSVKVEETERKGLVALVELNSIDFDFSKDEVKTMYYDLDNDGKEDKIEGRLWHRWGRIIWKVKFSSGKTFEDGTGCKRIGVSKAETNGYHDIICDLDGVLKWNGKKYE